ncbi:hypothetical protein [Oscillibacter sp. GMB15532]|uniref:hypothetical protein n=1 Tax=Oscillibacter sp. GMB15532 TaxID=3230022 RepID=UPI0034DF9603
MLGLSEYIQQRISEDAINERDRLKRLDNVKICTNYVLDYFTSYIDISPEEEITAEKKKKIERYKKYIRKYSDEIIEWLVQDYVNYGRHVDRLVAHVIGDPFFLLYTEDHEFRSLSYKVYAALSKRCPFLSEQSEMLFRFVKDYHRVCTEHGERRIGESFHNKFFVNTEIDNWITETFCECHVDLLEFAYQYIKSFFNSYDNWPANHRIATGQKYFPYKYNYKNLDNLFNIDQLYRNIPKKKFIRGKKQELEVLMMYYCKQQHGHDNEFWRFYLKELGLEVK